MLQHINDSSLEPELQNMLQTRQRKTSQVPLFKDLNAKIDLITMQTLGSERFVAKIANI